MEEIRNYRNSSPSKSYLAVFLNPCFYSLLLYRASNFFYRKRVIILAKILWFINRIIFSIDIDYRATIGKNFIIVHGIGIVIGLDVVIGDNVKIYQGVTLGGNGRVKNIKGKDVTQPQIGNNVIIYTNACIFGPVIIKDNTKVKACTLTY